jgi:hypothetical protein
MTQLPYDKRDSASILAYLEDKASLLSNGRWTDFSDADIGTVILKLMSYLADMNNYQIDKGLSELYIDTATERESVLSLIKLIGYEPRGYSSAKVNIDVSLAAGHAVKDGTVIPAYTEWSNDNKSISFHNIEDVKWMNNTANLDVYEGSYISLSKSSTDIDDNSRLYLSDYNVDKKTMRITVSGDVLNRVDNVLTDTSETLSYSVHIDSQSKMYIQLPSYWSDFITSGTNIGIEYLTTKGTLGSIGSHIITRPFSTLSLGFSDSNVNVDNNLASTGAEDPETIEEMRKGAPIYASTMDTLVTLEDIELVKSKVDGIADIVALDYNTTESGLVQPADAYKVNVYVLPKDLDYIVDPAGTLTDVGKALKSYVDKRRLTSIIINYLNVEIITPNIEVTAYINKYDLRADTLANDITNLLLDKYSKENTEIGQGIYSSTMSKQILDEINYCNYIEINLPNDSYIPTKMQFLKVQKENITVHVVEE